MVDGTKKSQLKMFLIFLEHGRMFGKWDVNMLIFYDIGPKEGFIVEALADGSKRPSFCFNSL